MRYIRVLQLAHIAALVQANSHECSLMGRHKPDFVWTLALLVALGAVSVSLFGGDREPAMAPLQAGIIVQ